MNRSPVTGRAAAARGGPALSGRPASGEHESGGEPAADGADGELPKGSSAHLSLPCVRRISRRPRRAPRARRPRAPRAARGRARAPARLATRIAPLPLTPRARRPAARRPRGSRRRRPGRRRRGTRARRLSRSRPNAAAAEPDRQERRRERDRGREQRPAEPRRLADERDRMGDRAGRELPEGDRVEELGLGHPAVAVDRVLLHQRDDHEAAAVTTARRP